MQRWTEACNEFNSYLMVILANYVVEIQFHLSSSALDVANRKNVQIVLVTLKRNILSHTGKRCHLLAF